MGDPKALAEAAEEAAELLLRQVRRGRRLIIVGHLDADGLTSSSLLAKAIYGEGGHFHLTIVSDLTPQLVRTLAKDERGFYVFVDLGAGLAKDLQENFGDRWLVIDHHEPPEEERALPSVFNCWKYGYDGGEEACSATMAYLVAKALRARNQGEAWLPVLGALADRQDRGEGGSLISLNRAALEEAQQYRPDGATPLLHMSRDLLLPGRETRPVHEALAALTLPYLPNLSGNRDACYSALKAAGLRLKEGERWRVLAELTEDEKKLLLDTILAHVQVEGSKDWLLQELVGEVYTLLYEDRFTPLRDAREFSTLLNACGRTRRHSLGVALCMGDRGPAMNEAVRALREYRQTITGTVAQLTSLPEKVIERGPLAQVIGDGIVTEEMTGVIASVLSSLPRFARSFLLLRSATVDGDIKLSIRAPYLSPTRVNLGQVMREAAQKVGGIGGGHARAAGARIPFFAYDKFAREVASWLEGHAP
ncbi:MAG: single-stranded DNA exonuclease RecJ [Nitrososphaerota archaeon]